MKRLLLLLIPFFSCASELAKDAMDVYGFVLAGGVGERLWPLSRTHNPKQFLSIDTDKNLLEQAIERLEGIMPSKNIWGITSKTHADQFRVVVGDKLGAIIIEPSARNTGPAVLLACLELYEKNPNAVVVFVPADPYIPDQDKNLFQSYLKKAISFAETNEGIVLCGAYPTYPATGYGYIEYMQDNTHAPIYQVARFHEKPSLAIARNYIQQSHMLWNIGMFVAKVSSFITEFKNNAPDLYEEMMAYRAGKIMYQDITTISVDCALIEKSNKVWVLPVDFSWCDVGNVRVLLSLKDEQKRLPHNVISVDAQNNLVDVQNKLVALVGVEDLCVVETDDALLISKNEDAEKVRNVVAQLRKNNQLEYL